MKSVLNIRWKDWWWSWNSNTLATWCEELTHWKRPWFWEKLKVGGKGMTEDEMVGWHHQLNGHNFEEAPGVGDGQGSLECCSPRSHKELDMTEWLDWPEPGLWDFSSPTRDWTWVSTIRACSSGHWTVREFPDSFFQFLVICLNFKSCVLFIYIWQALLFLNVW